MVMARLTRSWWGPVQAPGRGAWVGGGAAGCTGRRRGEGLPPLQPGLGPKGPTFQADDRFRKSLAL